MFYAGSLRSSEVHMVLCTPDVGKAAMTIYDDDFVADTHWNSSLRP